MKKISYVLPMIVCSILANSNTAFAANNSCLNRFMEKGGRVKVSKEGHAAIRCENNAVWVEPKVTSSLSACLTLLDRAVAESVNRYAEVKCTELNIPEGMAKRLDQRFTEGVVLSGLLSLEGSNYSSYQEVSVWKVDGKDEFVARYQFTDPVMKNFSGYLSGFLFGPQSEIKGRRTEAPDLQNLLNQMAGYRDVTPEEVVNMVGKFGPNLKEREFVNQLAHAAQANGRTTKVLKSYERGEPYYTGTSQKLENVAEKVTAGGGN